MRCLILDDDVMFSLELKKRIDKFLSKLFSDYTTDIINNKFENYNDYSQCDLIFADIDLKKSNGIDVIKKLQMLESRATIIYVSSRQELVFTSLSTRPFYFVRKQKLDEDLNDVFKLLTNYYQKIAKIVTFDFYGVKTSVFLKDIHYLVACGHDISIITNNGMYTYRSTLKDIIQFIDSNLIVRVQKGYAVSLMFVKEVDGMNIILQDNTKIPMGRKYSKEFLEKYREYLIL